MSTEKMREEFESAWSVVMGGDDGVPGHKPTRSSLSPETYAGGAAEFAWKWWKRSRAAIEVELPAPNNDYTYSDREISGACEHHRRAKAAIESLGLKVKS